jgi:hypothetical protein
VFDAGGRAVLAVIARGTSSTAYVFGRGAHQAGAVLTLLGAVTEGRRVSQ